MTVRVTIEYKNVDEAITSLGKLSSAAVVVPSPAELERKPRNDKGQKRGAYGPRDKGQGAGATTSAAEAQKPGDGSTGVTESRSATTEGAVSTPGAASSTVPVAGGPTASAPEKSGAVQAGSTTAPAPSDPKSVVQSELLANTNAFDGKPVSDADLEAASVALAEAKGVQTVIDALARFGVKRGRDLPINRRAEYIDSTKKILAGAAA